MSTARQRFGEWSATLADITGVLSLLGWDRETLMPPGGAEARTRHLGTLATLHHRELVRPDMASVLDELAGDDTLSEAERRQLQLALRERRRAERLPESLVREMSDATSRSVTAWLAARASGDFPAFAPSLAEVVRTTRRAAALLRDDGTAYDALLDRYEPGARAVDLGPVFESLMDAIPPLVHRDDPRPDVLLPLRHWPAEAQLALARELAVLIGFDLERGVLAGSAHPFTTHMGRGDVRFTTRLDTANPIDNITAVMHEAGHALYEQGFPDDVWGTPLQTAPSMGVHESQARFWENHVGRRPAFWRRIAPIMEAAFPVAMDGLDPAILHSVATQVRPSLVRTDADEVTYNLHIALRFTLEVALIEGELEVEALPAEWDRLTSRLLGITPPHAGLGVMQDIHWAEGLFGYFPTYTLGNVYAAQLASTADRVVGGVDAAIEDGRLDTILGFLRERVHRPAGLHPAAELMQLATGRALDTGPLIDHLTDVAASSA